jgi:hypothetical protein
LSKITCTSSSAGTSVDLVQEDDEVGAGVGFADVGDDLARGDFQRGEEIAGAVALVVVGGPLGRGRQERQRRRRPVQRLDLGFSSTAKTAALT